MFLGCDSFFSYSQPLLSANCLNVSHIYKESPGSRNVSDQAAKWSAEGPRNKTFWSSRSANSISHRETNWGDSNPLISLWQKRGWEHRLPVRALPDLPDSIGDHQQGGTELNTRTAASEVLPTSPAGVHSWGQRRTQALWIFCCDCNPWPSHSLSTTQD